MSEKKKNWGKILGSKNKKENKKKSKQYRILNEKYLLEELYINHFEKLEQNKNNYYSKIVDPDELEWRTIRELRISGTMCYRIFKWKGESLSVFKKLISKDIPLTPNYNSKKFEKEIIWILNKNTKLFNIKKGGIHTCPIFPWTSSTPDGIIFFQEKPIGILEIKTSKNNIYETDYFEKSYPFLINKKSRLFYQIQHTLNVFRLSFCIFIFKDKNRIFYSFEFLQNSLTLDLFEKLRKFYLEFYIPFVITEKFPYNMCIRKKITNKKKIIKKKYFFYKPEFMRLKENLKNNYLYQKYFLKIEVN